MKAALLTLAITLIGFFFIGQLDSMRANELRASVDELLFQSDSERFLFLYTQTLGNGTGELCGYFSTAAKKSEDRAYSLSEKIHFYEQSNIINSEYEKIRGEYYLSNAALYLNILSAKKYCGSSPYDTVLFFYGIKKDCPECRAQGGVLDKLRAKYPNMRVFAFPYDSDYEFISLFVRRHNIQKIPSLVIDDSVVLEGLQNEDEVASRLK